MGIHRTAQEPVEAPTASPASDVSQRRSVTRGGGRRRSLAVPLSLLQVLLGGVLFSIANNTLSALFAGFLIYLFGITLAALVFRGKSQELRVFLLVFGTCVFVGGLAQVYAEGLFGRPMSTLDANKFFGAILEKPPYYTLSELSFIQPDSSALGFGAPLAVMIWQQVYHVFSMLGFPHGPYIGVIFNALIVGLSGSLTVGTARELFGDDRWRLRRVGTLFAFCGIFWLFGAIMIRDCFTLFLNLLVLWGLVRWLRRPIMRNLAFSLILTVFAGLCMWYLRKNSTYLFGLFYMLAFFCWYWRGRKGLGHVFATLALPVILSVASVFLFQFFSASIGALATESGNYVGLAANDSKADSLGMALVVNQPLPIRATAGSGVLLAFPIPLWAYIGPGATEYTLFKTWQGIYKLFLVPLFFAGLWLVLKRVLRKETDVTAYAFVALYAVMMLLAVAATSLETRHFGQFMPAMVLLAVVPDTRRRDDRKRVRSMAFLWLSVLLFVHLVWATMRFL